MNRLEKIDPERSLHFFIAGENGSKAAIEAAMTYHLPLYETNSTRRTRISLLLPDVEAVDDFIFQYKELLDHSYYRRVIVNEGGKVSSSLHRPVYADTRPDFVDVEWELIAGRISNDVISEKLKKWSSNPDRNLAVLLCYADSRQNQKYASILKRRLPNSVEVVEVNDDPEAEAEMIKEFTPMAKYLNYCYKMSFETGSVPAELPEDEVEKAWAALPDEKMRTSSLHNVMSIPYKMKILGHDRNDWAGFYALTAKEIDSLAAMEHNRWTVELLIQGSRPCTDQERAEIEEDFRRRKEDREYARKNPLTLKKRYARERGAHYDLCAYSELGEDETGLSVARYDRDLTEAIPLIVKIYTDRHGNAKTL